MRNKSNNKFKGGFTLVETLVAISVFTVSILGMMSVLASGISDTNYAKQKMIASYLAQEGIEYMRNMRDTYVLYPANGDWNDFKNELTSCNLGGECGFDTSLYEFPIDQDFIKRCNTGDICKVYFDDGNYHTDSSGTDSGFTRKVWMTRADGANVGVGGDDEVRIYSKVEWTQGSGTYNVTFSENLFNWVELAP